MSIEAIKDLLDEVRTDLIKAGIKEHLLHDVETTEFPDEVNAALCRVIDKEFRRWLQIRAQLPESVWDYHEATGDREPVACRLLHEAEIALKRSWQDNITRLIKRKREQERREKQQQKAARQAAKDSVVRSKEAE